MDSTDIPKFPQKGFDDRKYFNLQNKDILKRISRFKKGFLYLEIGEKFMFDPHAARVLPGYDPFIKKEIFLKLKDQMQLLYCIDANDIKFNRQLKNQPESYQKFVLNDL